jgi:hypothetical protein
VSTITLPTSLLALKGRVGGHSWDQPPAQAHLSCSFSRLLVLQPPGDPGPTAPPLAPAERSVLA